MAVSEDLLNSILEQMSKFGPFEVKKMFGGVGFFKDDLMFGMIGSDTFRLKVDDHNKAEYEARGMKPMLSKSKGKGMPYWEVPEDIIDDMDELGRWAQKSFDAALRAKSAKKKSKPRT